MTRSWQRMLAYGVLPALILVLTLAAGALKWCDSSSRAVEQARTESVEAATDSTVAILSFSAGTVEQDMAATERLLTDGFRERFAQRIVEPTVRDAKARGVSSVAEIPGAAPVSVNAHRAVVLVFADQTLTLGGGQSTEVASSYRVTLDRVDGHWLVAKFEPV